MIKVTAVGRLVKDATVFTYGDHGKTGLNFTLACNNFRREDPTYLNCTMFGRDENLASYLLMGDQIIAYGDLDITNDGNGNYYTKLTVSDIEFGARKK